MPETQEKQSSFERTKELTDRLEAGMQELFQSDKYMDYLKSMSHFHNYSSRNIMLINMQMPGATRVASFKLWEEKFNRHVKKGERGIRIFAPVADKTPEKKLMEKLDPETGAPLLDKDGKVIMEEMTALTTGMRFKLVPVFDVGQTYGDPLLELVENLTGNVEHYTAFMDALKAVSPLPIEFEPLADGHDGYCRYGEKIGIREGMSEIQTVSAVIHEITHARLHAKGLENADIPKFVKEVQAESVSWVVAQHYNIETAPNSFGYLAEWGSRDMSEFKASLDTIRKESSALITAIGDRFRAICHERGIDLTPKEPEVPVVPEKPTEPEFTTETRTENIAGVDFEVTDIKPVEPEKEAVMDDEVYEITYWRNGTGTLALHYFNEDSGRYGDYEELARIAPDRSVVFVSDNLPDDVRAKINEYALTADIPNMAGNIHAAKAPPEPGEPDETMPDPAIGVSEMNLYGYTADDMLPLTTERAVELFNQHLTVYMLYDDNTEAMALDTDEIITFGSDGIFGITRAEWQNSKEYKDLAAQNSEAAKESDLINGGADTFAIYQLRSGDDLHYHRFASLKQLENDHLAVDRSNYELAYTAPLPPKETLDGIYERFNLERPKDFTGHSLSVSDIIVIQRGGEVSSHYIDNLGFAELPAFLGNERKAERYAVPEVEEKPIAQPVVERKLSEMLGLDLNKQLKQDNKTPPPLPEGKNQPIYMHPLGHARENGELDRYYESLKLNQECAKAIDNAIKDCIVPNGHGYRLTPESVSKVMDAYGEQRVGVVLANTVRIQEWDGRYSGETKAWAKDTELPQVYDKTDYFSASHPAVLDGYIRLARKELEKKPSVLEALKQGADKSRQQSEHKSEPKKSKEMEM